SSALDPFVQMWRPPFTCGWDGIRSRTIGFRPTLRSAIAAASPAMFPPTMTTSACASPLDREFAASTTDFPAPPLAASGRSTVSRHFARGNRADARWKVRRDSGMIAAMATLTATPSQGPRPAPGPRGHPVLGNTLGFKNDILNTLLDGWRGYGDIVRFRGV